MNVAIEKVIAIIIFVIVFLLLLIFTNIPQRLGKEIISQQELRECCSAYVVNGCPEFSDPVDLGYINCKNENLGTLVSKFSMNYETLKNFCNCP